MLRTDFYVNACDIVEQCGNERHIVREPHTGSLPARLADSLAQTAIHCLIQLMILDK
jgi:hypothetical protein